MRAIFPVCALVAASLSLLSNAAIAELKREEAKSNKTGNYISEGLFAAGVKTVHGVKLKDIRRAKSLEGYERIVFDLETAAEEKAMPYFQVQMANNEGRIVLSIWTDVAYDFDKARVFKAFAKSANVKKLNIVPRLEEDLSIIEIQLPPKKKAKVEAFHLDNPTRIIMDIL